MYVHVHVLHFGQQTLVLGASHDEDGALRVNPEHERAISPPYDHVEAFDLEFLISLYSRS